MSFAVFGNTKTRITILFPTLIKSASFTISTLTSSKTTNLQTLSLNLRSPTDKWISKIWQRLQDHKQGKSKDLIYHSWDKDLQTTTDKHFYPLSDKSNTWTSTKFNCSGSETIMKRSTGSETGLGRPLLMASFKNKFWLKRALKMSSTHTKLAWCGILCWVSQESRIWIKCLNLRILSTSMSR